jgi:hypothetical protein
MILLFTSRYLATGSSFRSLHYEYLLGVTTIREIARDTREAIWKCLRDAFMPQKSEKDWLHTADEFYDRTNFPNCIGAVDGKHTQWIPICQLQELLFHGPYGFSHADYCFISIDVGAYGASSDCNIFRN